MNPIETGKAIVSLRKTAGYTQAGLAEALDVSDKAVSKWERGLACPDISLLPKLSVLLDTDIEAILRGTVLTRGQRWKGILVLDELAKVPVYSKPLVYFLLSNFMLVGIWDVLIIGGNVESLLGKGILYGLSLTYCDKTIGEALAFHRDFVSAPAMIVYGNVIVYGAHLTRRYQSLMSLKNGAYHLQSYGGNDVPIMFCSEERWKQVMCRLETWKDTGDMVKDISPVPKPLVRGMTCLPVNDNEQILTAANFIRIIESAGKENVADLGELAKSRGLV